MNRRSWERMTWAATVIVLLLSVRQTIRDGRHGIHDGSSGRRMTQGDTGVPTLVMFDGDALDSAADRIAAHDPFRLERKPAAVAYNPMPTGIAAPVAPPAPAIRIVLQGTIGGPPWHAIISGVPGHAGTIVVSSGDTLGGVTIRRVKRDSVTVRVKDSTWTVGMTNMGAE